LQIRATFTASAKQRATRNIEPPNAGTKQPKGTLQAAIEFSKRCANGPPSDRLTWLPWFACNHWGSEMGLESTRHAHHRYWVSVESKALLRGARLKQNRVRRHCSDWVAQVDSGLHPNRANRSPISLAYNANRRRLHLGSKMTVEVGQLFGNYRMVRLLGEGGFGEVYLVENPLIQRRAAVKVLHTALAQDAGLVRRFLNEARAASAIRHPNIIDVLDAGGTADGTPYILMEFLEGVSLQRRLADVGRLALPQVLDIATQAGSALSAAHAAGIVHRDLKPENLFLVPDPSAPGRERVKVLDFGIAKIKHGSSSGGTIKTRTGIIMGSPAYMSPEQCKDSADVDLRSDVYSFATILYEMLAGRTPYVAASGTEMLVMHLTATPPPFRDLSADVPAHVEAAIMRALARARDDRFASVSSFLDALQARAVGGTLDLRQAEPLKKQPATHAKPESHLEGTVAPASATTFSRATGEVVAEDYGDQLFAIKRSRRWLPFAVGAVLVAGLGLFLLASSKPNQPSAPVPPKATPVSERDRVVAPVPEAPPLPAFSATPSSKPDGGAPAAALAGALPPSESAHAVEAPDSLARRHRRETKNTLLQKVPETARPNPSPSIPSPKKASGVAGF
jgi:serine/threonine protein kinase